MAVRYNAGDRTRHIEARGDARHGGHPLAVPGPEFGSKVEMRINDAWGQNKTVERNGFFRGTDVIRPTAAIFPFSIPTSVTRSR